MKFIFIFTSLLVTVVALVLMFFLGLSIKIRKTVLGHRYDDNHTLHYFSEKDFVNLKKHTVDFYSDKNKLKGYFYYLEDMNPKGIIVFVHGLGAGHIQYTTEINYFVNKQYLVFSYDTRGCLASEGKSIGFFQNAIVDLNNAIDYLKSNKNLNKYKTFLVGHSMGGYCVNNINQFRSDIDGIVSMDGFDSSIQLFMDFIFPIFKKASVILIPFFSLQEKICIKSLSRIKSYDSLNKTNIPTLIITGENDQMVNPNKNFYFWKNNIDNNNLSYLCVQKRYHRPNITIEAADYDLEVNKSIIEINKKYNNKMPNDVANALYSSFDYNLLVELDYEVMDTIIGFIEKINSENNSAN